MKSFSLRLVLALASLLFSTTNVKSQCFVDAGNDTTFCQQQGQLFATPLFSNPNYIFTWSPATGLNNPNTQNPLVISGVSNQTYVVTMTDTMGGCTAIDSVTVNAYYFQIDTVYSCFPDSFLLDFGPGATNYYWQFFTDTNSVLTMLNVFTQTYWATEPGTYAGYATFTGCGALTSVIVVEDSCTSGCAASIAQQTIYSSTCGDTMRFTGTYTGTIGNWVWEVNNQMVAYGNGGVPQFDWYIGTSTYTVTLTVYESNFSCNATSSVVVIGTSGIVPSINLIQACGVAWNSQQFNPSIVPASSNYTYSWTPATGLSDPTIRNPFVNGVFSQSYTLTVTDTVTGCVGIDTMNGVTVSNYVYETIYMCNNQPLTLTTYPAYPFFNYNWSSGQTTPSITVSQSGVYNVVIMTGNCTFTNTYTVIDSCNAIVPNVWPGDCNYDLVVNMADALHIGLAYGATGATRPNASNLWYAQPMVDWSQNYANCNYKHGDADGNGTVNVNDTLPISLNYTLTHPFRLGAPQVPATAPSLELYCYVDTVGLQTLVQVDVMLGTNTMTVDSLYGISFRITSDAGLIDTTLTVINATTSWLGNDGVDMFTFRKQFQNAAIVDFAEVRNDHTNRINGSGLIASYFIVTTDNLSGIAVCHFNISDVTAVTASQQYVQFATVNDSVVIDPTVPAAISSVEQPIQFNMYPNPANDVVTIQTGGTATLIEICDMSGRVVEAVQPIGNTSQLETSSLAAGMYFVRVTNGANVSTQKLTISR